MFPLITCMEELMIYTGRMDNLPLPEAEEVGEMEPSTEGSDERSSFASQWRFS